MIPISRRHASRKMETTLLSYSRQSLPRPARLYSTPTKAANAAALATSPISRAGTIPVEGLAIDTEMQGFLRRRTPYTILPTPLPTDAPSSALHDLYFTDSPTQDLVSVMDACLHNLYDVPRAKQIFEQLRTGGKGDAVLDARVYNSLLDAYVAMASLPTTQDRSMWLEAAWQLYNDMESGREKMRPTANTYALMLLAYLRFHPESTQAGDSAVRCNVETHDPAELLRHIIEHQIPVSLVVADRAFKSSEEANEAIRLLSRAAVNMGLSKVVNELGMAESLGRQGLDVLEDVPEAIPVTKPKVSDSRVS